MALLDEYKQAIQDVLDGRAKPAPKPSELPWTEDKLASMWAAAAAELIAEANSGGGGSSGGGVLMVHETISEGTHTLDKTWKEISDAANAGTIIYYITQSDYDEGYIMYATRIVYDGVAYCAHFSSPGGNVNAFFECETENGYPSHTE